MSIRIGDIDVVAQLLENEYRIAVLEQVVDLLVKRAPAFGGPPVLPNDLDQIRKNVVGLLQKKYPNSGISLKEPENEKS